MSTKTSADIHLSRSSTRLFAPPGGKSSISFGDDTPVVNVRTRTPVKSSMASIFRMEDKENAQAFAVNIPAPIVAIVEKPAVEEVKNEVIVIEAAPKEEIIATIPEQVVVAEVPPIIEQKVEIKEEISPIIPVTVAPAAPILAAAPVAAAPAPVVRRRQPPGGTSSIQLF